MNWHVGDTAMYAGGKVIVKRLREDGCLTVEDEEGFAFGVYPKSLDPIRRAADTTPRLAVLRGGEVVTDPAIPTCFICKRDVSDGDYVNVDYGLHVEPICSVCWSKRDEEYLTERLDNTDD